MALASPFGPAIAVVGAVGLGGPVIAAAVTIVGGHFRILRRVRRLGLSIALGRRLAFGRGLAIGTVLGRCGRRGGGGLFGVINGIRRLGIERLPVRDRDLVVVGVDFVEGQEAVAIAAVVDKCRLERGLHAHDLGEIDVSLELLPGSRFEVEFL